MADARDLRYLRLVTGRQRGLTEEEIAKLAGEEAPTLLYERVREDGHPICPKCGTTYVDENHCATGLASRSKDAPLARGAGPAIALPPASNAIPLFREALEALSRGNEDLKHRKEKLQAGLFAMSGVQTLAYEDARAKYTEDEWESLCEHLSEHYGFNPDERPHVREWSLGGGTPAPQPPLPALIAVYVLAGMDVKLLVELIHPEPESAQWDEILELVDGRRGSGAGKDGLKVKAEQIAKLVRGKGTLGRRPPGELPNHDLNISSRIRDSLEAGMTDEDIFGRLRNHPGLKDLSWNEFCRLRDLNREWPFH